MRIKQYSLMSLVFLFNAYVWAAPLTNENLLQKLPAGYILGFSQHKGNMLINEWIPKGQTVHHWNEMLTTQIFYGLKKSPETFFNMMKQSWATSCPGGTSVLIKKGTENNYPFIFWISVCPKNPTTGQMENTYFKGIEGQDSFYLVQKAAKFDMLKDKSYIVKWSQYMKSIEVCDSRRPGSACPKVAN